MVSSPIGIAIHVSVSRAIMLTLVPTLIAIGIVGRENAEFFNRLTEQQQKDLLAAAAEAERQKTREALNKAEEDGKVLAQKVLLEARETVAREENAARAKLPDAVAYLMERVDTQV